MTLPWQSLLSAASRGLVPSGIREVLKLLDRPGILSFAGGIPDAELFPMEALRTSYERHLRDGAGLQYSQSEGLPALREWIAARLAARDVDARAERVLVTSGSQQALDLVARSLIEPGDRILVTSPTYLGALQAFAPCRPTFIPLPCDADGPVLAALDAALRGRPKLLYLVPDFNNPTGTTIPLANRRAIVAMCAAKGVPIVEDAAYDDLVYDGAPLPPMASFDPEAVIHCGTFSKTLVPGLRVGWIHAAPALMAKLALAKQGCDLHSGTIGQMVVADLARDVLPDHLPVLRSAYAQRRDAMLEALDAAMPAGTQWTRPRGGMFVWLRLPNGLDSGALLRRAIAEADVAYVPGAPFHVEPGHGDTLRLSFSSLPPDSIREGIARLGTLVRDAV